MTPVPSPKESTLSLLRHFERLFAGLDHLFKRSPNATPSLSDYLQPRPVDAGFLDVVCSWLEARLKP